METTKYFQVRSKDKKHPKGILLAEYTKYNDATYYLSLNKKRYPNAFISIVSK